MHEPFYVINSSWKKSGVDLTVACGLIVPKRNCMTRKSRLKYFFLSLLLKFILSVVAGFQEKTRHGTLLFPYAIVAGVLSCCFHVGGNIFFYRIAVACGAQVSAHRPI